VISIGDRLDATYLVTGRLGSGGFGEVFLTEDEVIPGRYVALKALSGPAAAAEDNLIWELVALSQFNHPGVVAFHHHFSHANPRIHVQKELGWLQLEEGHLPIAISLLSDHLDRHGADFEACNLLLKCFYLSARYDVAEGLAQRVSIGSWAKNDIALDDASVCRRHALIANFPNDVWLYDLGSTRGTRLGGDAVPGRAFLDGVHRVMVGRLEIEIDARADLLV